MLHCASPAQESIYKILPAISVSNTDDLRCLYFDRQGVLWIGTSAGLKSYDGHQMRTYRSDAYSPGIFPNNVILCITEDKNDDLWLGTRDGLVRMNKRNGTFRTYHLKGEKQRIIYTLFTAKDGTVWIGTDGGLTRYVPEKDDFLTYDLRGKDVRDFYGKHTDLPEYSVKSIVEDSNGNLFLGTWGSGVLHFDIKRNAFVQYPKTNDNNSAYSLYIDSKGRLWIGTWGLGIERIDNPLGKGKLICHKWESDSPIFNTYYKIMEDKGSGTLWACGREGMGIMDLANEEEGFRHLQSYNGLNATQFDLCTDMATDKNGNIWLGTLNNGIKHIRTHKSLFKFHELQLSDIRIPTSTVCAIYTPDGTDFWLGLRPYGVVRYNSATGRVSINKDIPAMTDMGMNVMGSAITSIVKRNDNELWMASNSHGIVSLPTSGEKATLFNTTNCKFLFDNFVNVLYTARDGRTWIGTRSGVSIADTDNSGEKLEMTENGDDFSNCDVQGICEDHAGNIWISTENEGIIKVNGRKYTHYVPTNGKFPIYDATNCFEDSRHRLWAVSNGGGLFRYEEGDDRFVPVNRTYHIDGQKAFGINEDNEGGLWIATDKALVRLTFDKDGRSQVAAFSHEDGLDDFMFYKNAAFRIGERMFFCSRNGFIDFVPKNINSYRAADKASLVVTDIIIGDTPWMMTDSTLARSVSKEAPGYTRCITIPASVEKFAIEFSLLTFINQEQNKYAYKLEGYDNEWHYQNSDIRRATFENLPSGTYRLHLKASDSYGNVTELPYTIKVRVLPPWYLSWWAFVVYLLIVGLAVWCGIRWYKNYLKTKNRLAMVQFFTNITHELLTPLTVISSSVDELRRVAPQHSDSYGVMQNNISRLTRLLRQILEVKKSQAGQLRLKVTEGNLDAFVRKACDNVMPMAKEKRLEINVDCAPVVGYFDTDKLDKVLYNLLSNAIKYSHEGRRIDVTLSVKDGNTAVLTVADEGIGISKDKMKHLYTMFLDGDYRRMNTSGTGIGLSLTRDLVRLHHGDIECRSEENAGTVFTVTLPMAREAYMESEMDDCPAETVRETGDKAAADDTAERAEDKEYTMLIVDDNAELLALMQRLLCRKYDVLTARNGQQAWNIINKHDLDIVISDVMMPVMDGIELTRIIKESDDFAQLPVILLTSKVSDDDRNEGYAVGADEYITKPFRLEELELRVNNIILNRERIRRKFKKAELDVQGTLKTGSAHYSSPDELFLQRAIDCVKQNISEYGREQFASDMCVSPSTLYNKLRALTGQNITAFINSIRMKEACRIARAQPDIRVNELAMMVGITTPKYFTKCFKDEFGMSPSEFLSKLHE